MTKLNNVKTKREMCKTCKKMQKNCICSHEIAIVENSQNSQFEFENSMLREYFENFGSLLQNNEIEIMIVNDDLLQLSSITKSIEIYFDEKNSIYRVRSILNKFKNDENMSKYYRNILNLKSLKACISYSHCHLNIAK